MAITQSNKGSILEQAGKIVNQEDSKDKPSKKPKQQQESKKLSFVASTIEELKLVEWPSLGYVIKWSLVIIVFTFFLSMFIFLVDRIFQGGLEFFSCTSEDGVGAEEIRTCASDYGQYIFFQD